MNFTYLISMCIWKGSPEILTFLDDILEHIGVVVDKEVANRSKHYQISVLMVTTLRSFESCVLVEYKNDKKAFVDFEFYQPLA